MNRRELVQVVAGTAVAHSVVTVLGCGAQPKGQPAAPEHASHHHHHEGGNAPPSPVTPQAAALADIAAQCARTGETCLEHCIRLLAAGDTSVASCARTVHEMLAICRATASLASIGSGYLKDMARICAAACDECARACEVHAQHHAECRACAESCRKTQQAATAFA